MEAGGREGGKEGSWEGASKRGREAFTWRQPLCARSGPGSPAPAAMDEERALYIVRAGEAGAIERVLRDYSDKVKSSGPERVVWHPRAALRLVHRIPPNPPHSGDAHYSPCEDVSGLGMRVCAPSLSRLCICIPLPPLERPLL